MAFDFSDFKLQASKILDHFQNELAPLRTGRASVQLLDPVMVEAYGTRMKLAEVAAVSVPDANMLVISPWDKSLLAAVERAVNEANLNLSPVVDGQVVRIVIPPLTQERREQMVKLVQQKTESVRAMMRLVRTDVKREIDKQKGQAGISEDNIAADEAQLETLFKQYNQQLEDMSNRKNQDLMTI